MSHWAELVLKVTAKDIIHSRHRKPLITLRDTTPLKEALHTFAANDILSAPIFDQNSKFIGFIDVLDIVSHLVSVWRKQAKNMNNQDSAAAQEFFQTPVAKISNASMWDYPVHVEEGSSLAYILEAFSGGSRHFKPHRVGVLGPKSNVEAIISQSDVLAFAASHLKDLPKGDKTLKELGLVRSCIMARLDSTVVDALNTIYFNRVSGIALVDAEGHLSGNLSASDFRGILPEGFEIFYGSILQFLCKGTTSHPRAPVTVNESTTFREVVKILSSQRIHRVFIVDQYLRPTGVVTLSDVLEHLLF